MVRSGAAPHKRVHRNVPPAPRKRPLVTVVVPAYNYGRFLVDCATSVLTQRDVDVRLLIADDCSTDDTPLVTDGLAASDPRVSVIRNERNKGHIPTVNEGLALVDSEFVVKLDADDLLTPGSLARATALLEAHPEVGFVYGRPHHFSGPVPSLRDSTTRSWTIWPGEDWVAARCGSSANVISQPEVVMRTALVRRAGFFCSDLPHTSDLHLWMKLASRGDVGRINGPEQGLYRVHPASMQRTVHAGIMLDLEGRRDAFDAALASRAGADELRRVARQTLAVRALDIACRAYDRGRTNGAESARRLPRSRPRPGLPVDDLVAFALDTCPEARQLPEWNALEHRRSVGAGRAQLHPRFFAEAVTRRVSEQLCRWHWLRTGEC